RRDRRLQAVALSERNRIDGAVRDEGNGRIGLCRPGQAQGKNRDGESRLHANAPKMVFAPSRRSAMRFTAGVCKRTRVALRLTGRMNCAAKGGAFVAET